MKFKKILILAATMLAFSSTQFAQADLALANQLDVIAIESIQIEPDGNSFIATVAIIFENTSQRKVLLDEGDFDVSIYTFDRKQKEEDLARNIKKDDREYEGEESPLRIGRGMITNLEIPATTGSLTGRVTYNLLVRIDASDGNPSERLRNLFNVIGNPGLDRTLMLKGDCVVGAWLKRGWVKSNTLSVDFTFTPKIENTVLLQ